MAATGGCLAGTSTSSRSGANWHWAAQSSRGCRQRVRVHGILDSYRRDKGLLLEPSGPTQLVMPQAAPAPAAVAPSPPSPSAHPAATLLEVPDADGLTWSEDDTPCPVECVLEVYNESELQDVLDSVAPTTLVVADFYKTACGACRYIAPGFVRLCKANSAAEEDADAEAGSVATTSSSTSSSSSSSSGAPPVVFVKHNVYLDDEEEVSALARKLGVRSVPLFKFWKAGVEVDSFATRDKARLVEAITRHAGPGVFED